MIDKYNVIEWEDGWIQFNVTEHEFIIHSLFSEKNTKLKFNYIYRLAKLLNKKEIVFETERNPEGWIKLINSIARKLNNKSKTKIKCYVLGVTLD